MDRLDRYDANMPLIQGTAFDLGLKPLEVASHEQYCLNLMLFYYHCLIHLAFYVEPADWRAAIERAKASYSTQPEVK